MTEPQPYASFGRRLSAGLIDALIYTTITLIVGWITSLSKTAAYLFLPLLVIATMLYEPVLHAIYGATFGKFATSIRVVRVGGEPISWTTSLVRSSVQLAILAYWAYCVVSGIFSMPPEGFHGQGWGDLFQVVSQDFPSTFATVETIWTVWFWSEFATVLLNKKRRAIHDFLAGTIVVRCGKRGRPII